MHDTFRLQTGVQTGSATYKHPQLPEDQVTYLHAHRAISEIHFPEDFKNLTYVGAQAGNELATPYDPSTIHVSAQPPFSRSDLYTCRLGRSRDGLRTHIYMALLYGSSGRQQERFALNTQQRSVVQTRHQDTMAVSLPLVLIDDFP